MPGLWSPLDKPTAKEAVEGNTSPLSHSVLLVEDIPAVKGIVTQWEKEAAILKAWIRENEPSAISMKRLEIPPALRQPRLLDKVARISIFHSMASTSWSATIEEIQQRVSRNQEELFMLIKEDPNKARDSIIRMLRAQTGTWLEMLLARDYPVFASKLFQGSVALLGIKEGMRDRDGALAQLVAASSVNLETTCKAAFEVSNAYVDELIRRIAGRGDIRMTLPYPIRRGQVHFADGRLELLPLVANGTFIVPSGGTSDSLLVRRANHASTREPRGRTIVFRLLNYEISVAQYVVPSTSE